MRRIAEIVVAWIAGASMLAATPLGATSAQVINMLDNVDCLHIEIMLGAGLETKGAQRDFVRLFASDRDRSQKFKVRLREELEQRLAESGINVAAEQDVALLVGIWGRSTGQIGPEPIYTYLIEVSVADDRACQAGEEELDPSCFESETRKTLGSTLDTTLEERLVTEVIELVEEGWLDWMEEATP